MSKFTPGAWTFRKCGKHWNNPNLERIEINHGSDQECIADTVYEEADARLIAAAPAMYEALKACAEFIHYYDQEHNIGDGKVLEQAIAALRAADGGE